MKTPLCKDTGNGSTITDREHAQIFAVGQSVTVSLAAANGLGQSVEKLSASRVASLQKVRTRHAAGITPPITN